MTEVAGRRAPGAGRALAWSFGSGIFSKISTLAIGVLLARVLGPDAFGTFAVAFVALSAILSFNELGVSLAIVRWTGDPARIAPTVTTISVATSGLLAGAAFLAAPAYAEVMGDPAATAVVRVMLIGILVDGIVATPAALLQREFRQGTRTGIDQLNIWLGLAVSVACALLGLGAMSLAVGRVAGSVASGIAFLVVSPLPVRLGWDRTVARSLLRFGLPLAGASIIVFAVGYADQIVIGNLMGASILGFYVLATNLANWPVTMFSTPLRAVAPAAFARIQDDPEKMSRAFQAAFRLVAAAAIPVCFFLAGSAEPVIRVVYGDVWAPAAQALQWLALFAALRILFELAYDSLVVLRRTRQILLLQACWVVLLIPALIVGVGMGGIAGAGIAQLAVAAIVILPLYLILLSRAGIAGRRLLVALVSPVVAGAAVLAAARIAAQTVQPELVAAVVGGVAAVVAVGVLLLVHRGALGELRANWAARAEPVAEPSERQPTGEGIA